MSLFSERYGYITPSDVFIRERLTPEIQNAICSCYDRLENNASGYDYIALEKYIWRYFLNNRENDFVEDFVYAKSYVFTNFVLSKDIAWYHKLDIVEFVIEYLYDSKCKISAPVVKSFIFELNSEFARLNFAYRIINKKIVEITSQEEIVAVEAALAESTVTVRRHINEALKLLSQRPTPDCRNSIKESISAVEAFCREKTGENTLGKALNKLDTNGINIPKMLKEAFDKLYAYTNQKDTGIRHALMDDDGKYIPSSDEAIFILVSCSAFINYLGKKVNKDR